ncbi:MAG: AIR synthase related protein, partial [Anaerolineales bacterium]|nr:AIR synthase related protein [Anaerolineales bacterium]
MTIGARQKISAESRSCPIPFSESDRILLGHGSGGKQTHRLVREIFRHHFDNPALAAGNDAAHTPIPAGQALAISTDCHVVKPLFFPGGDIGKLAVCGTVNDVAMLGADPLYLTAGFILEEGLLLADLEKIAGSMQFAAEAAGVFIVAGDTKVVEQGSCDGMYIATAGVGVVRDGIDIRGANARPGDIVILSGPIG